MQAAGNREGAVDGIFLSTKSLPVFLKNWELESCLLSKHVYTYQQHLEFSNPRDPQQLLTEKKHAQSTGSPSILQILSLFL